ncbi:MAG TPA: phosphoribosylformylglycinamidine cyclo-ligase [Vicinamibacterales bacterium]|nr:phosphoribosylformylglycinamidine cyclo-ligase [Vicinamibacterales bacterium]
MDYKDSGVDIDAGNETVRRIRALARSTFTGGVMSEIGSFGGLFRLDATGSKDAILVASADGVGTKLKVAFMANMHRTIGIDLVNHCVNDILVQGARPLFFLDYLATGRLQPDVAEQVVEGLARGCRENGCALLGGETAEMPGFYSDGEYDLAGFIVGSVDAEHLIDGRSIAVGDVLIGLPSSGLHTNGYSLARRIAFEHLGLSVDTHVDALGDTIGNALLKPHRSYLHGLYPLIAKGAIKGMAHITGGGLTDNLPRILPPGIAATIARASWQVPPLFQWLQQSGDVPDDDMLRTFNMGIGLVLVCTPALLPTILDDLRTRHESPVLIGEITRGDRTVSYR